MTLSDTDLERYARHVIVPGVGSSGQARLLAARVEIAGQPRAVDTCRRYLERSGVCVVTPEAGGHRPDCLIAVGVDSIADAVLERWGSLERPLLWSALRPAKILRGYLDSYAGHRPTPRADTTPEPPAALSAIAAADAAGLTLALLLTWPLPSDLAAIDLT
jgi:hypothetical protein